MSIRSFFSIYRMMPLVNSKFHKICQFENHVTRNDVIMMALPKTMEKQLENADFCRTKRNIYLSKRFDGSFPKKM